MAHSAARMLHLQELVQSSETVLEIAGVDGGEGAVVIALVSALVSVSAGLAELVITSYFVGRRLDEWSSVDAVGKFPLPPNGCQG